MDFVSRYQSLQIQRVSSDELIKDLLLYCESVERTLREKNTELVQQLNETQFDLEDAKNSRRELQHHLIDITETNASLKVKDSSLNRNLYVLVLIDGDGLMFLGEFLRQGIEGGKKAAYALRAEIAGLCGKPADDVEVIAKVYANLNGLSRAMQRHGVVEKDSDFKDFTLGFTQAKASFDFVDVGQGKERADSKIKEATRWNLRNHNCKQILLGISHDSGYAPFLDEILNDGDARNRVTVIEGVPAVRELRNTGVNMIQIDTLFRKDKLLDKLVDGRPVSRRPSPFDHGPASPTNAALFHGSAVAAAGPTSSPMTPSSWAGITANANVNASTSISTSASPPPQIFLPLVHKNAAAAAAAAAAAQGRKSAQVDGPETSAAAWNPGRRGLDEPIVANPVVVDAIKKRKERLCNIHYLRGYCGKGNDCSFEHRYRVSDEELKALALLARFNPCGKRQNCDLDSCIYGHHCPSVKDGVCVHPYCKFRVADHPPDTSFKNRNIKDN
ncbi:hypothetical protein SODALDRAFT_374815 [Sodiomyces alkalinus F11]|uniref:C3H1-type domain-containing protein n=1 Tax=Sodiomyces alkalinus (strain CBS 110278 / VKM F-3762 / F11) TaxID=1314773 RepID=A0A3N2Q754_SODAK|nr:hypothetical protein SODALDRAFT_374815 [Sodiomyces alkalinus F11]ROT42488.1 hypothetical protein SODALDRAFT_374815 [Sodiomyces alkalinus F11]